MCPSLQCHAACAARFLITQASVLSKETFSNRSELGGELEFSKKNHPQCCANDTAGVQPTVFEHARLEKYWNFPI